MSESQFSKILLDRYQSGDALAAAEIWNRYASRLKSLADRRLFPSLAAKIDADDILQTTFLEFFEKANRDKIFWQQQGDLWRLLASIAIHHVGRQSEKFLTSKRDLTREASVSDLANVSVAEDDVARKMNQLIEPLLQDGDSTLAAVVLGRLAGKTLVDIAAETGRSERTLRRILQKAKAGLIADSVFNTGFERESSASHDTLTLSAKYSNFELLKMVGAGGFGKVYLARDKECDRVVAVKALRRDWIGNATAEQLFLNEAATIARLDHPHIVRFHQAGPLPNGSWFIVMDYVSGQSLDQLSLRDVAPENLMDWIRQTASALAYLHRSGIIHGDLKPSNLLIEDQTTVRLIDFGFSMRAGADKKWRGGTSGFRAPERETSMAADVFSMGRVIQYVLQKCCGKSTRPLEELARRAAVVDPQERIGIEELLEQLG